MTSSNPTKVGSFQKQKEKMGRLYEITELGRKVVKENGQN